MNVFELMMLRSQRQRQRPRTGTLTAEQTAVIASWERTDAPWLEVVAGAGTGKTFTLIRAVHALLNTKTSPTPRVLVVSFTKTIVATLQKDWRAFLKARHIPKTHPWHTHVQLSTVNSVAHASKRRFTLGGPSGIPPTMLATLVRQDALANQHTPLTRRVMPWWTSVTVPDTVGTDAARPTFQATSIAQTWSLLARWAHDVHALGMYRAAAEVRLRCWCRYAPIRAALPSQWTPDVADRPDEWLASCDDDEVGVQADVLWALMSVGAVWCTHTHLERAWAQTLAMDVDGPTALPRLSRRDWKFDAVVVDEAQDCERNTVTVLTALAQRRWARVMVVGDPRQHIYQFRQQVSLFDTPSSAFSRHRYTLSASFRCPPQVCALANAMWQRVPEHAASDMTPLTSSMVSDTTHDDVCVDESAPQAYLRLQNGPVTPYPSARRAASWTDAMGLAHALAAQRHDVVLLCRTNVGLLECLNVFWEHCTSRPENQQQRYLRSPTCTWWPALAQMFTPKTQVKCRVVAGASDLWSALRLVRDGNRRASSAIAEWASGWTRGDPRMIDQFIEDMKPMVDGRTGRDAPTIKLSTIHRFKGREASHVVIGPDLDLDVADTEEANLWYVAITRARNAVFVDGRVYDWWTRSRHDGDGDVDDTARPTKRRRLL